MLQKNVRGLKADTTESSDSRKLPRNTYDNPVSNRLQAGGEQFYHPMRSVPVCPVMTVSAALPTSESLTRRAAVASTTSAAIALGVARRRLTLAVGRFARPTTYKRTAGSHRGYRDSSIRVSSPLDTVPTGIAAGHRSTPPCASRSAHLAEWVYSRQFSAIRGLRVTDAADLNGPLGLARPIRRMRASAGALTRPELPR